MKRAIIDDTPPPRDDSALKLFSSLEDGRFQDEAGGAVREVILTLRKLAEIKNGPTRGKVTIEMDIAMAPDGVMEVTGDIKAKTPKIPRVGKHIVTDEDGDQVTGMKPRQVTIEAVRSGKTDPDKIPEPHKEKITTREPAPAGVSGI